MASPFQQALLASISAAPTASAIVDTGVVSPGSNSISITGANFGPDYSGRTILVAIAVYSSTNQNCTISSATVGGASMISQVSHWRNQSSSSTVSVGLLCAAPSGTSGNITITLNAIPTTVKYWVISVPKLSPQTMSASDTNDAGNQSNSGYVAYVIPAGGFGCTVGCQIGNHTFTPDGITQQDFYSSASPAFNAAILFADGIGTGVSVTNGWAYGSTDRHSECGASWAVAA